MICGLRIWLLATRNPGPFDEAVKCQRNATDLPTGEDREKYESEFNERLKLYQSGKPYRENP